MIYHALNERTREVPCRIHRDGIAGVYARALDMLHDAGDQDLLSVADGVHLDLGTHQVLVDQNRVVDSLLQDDAHVFAHVVIRKRDDHILPAQHVTRANQHGIAQRICRLQCLLLGLDRPTQRALDRKPFQQRIEPLAILRRVDAIRRSAEDAHALFRKKPRELDRGLSAEGDHHAVWLLRVDHVHHVLRQQRLKIEPVGGVKVG